MIDFVGVHNIIGVAFRNKLPNCAHSLPWNPWFNGQNLGADSLKRQRRRLSMPLDGRQMASRYTYDCSI